MPVEQDHQAVQELLGAYALDSVPSEEIHRIERHLVSCTDCRQELAEHREVAALLAVSEPFAPADVWDSIATEIATPPSVSELRPQRRWLTAVAVAAAFALATGVAVVQSLRLADTNEELAAERQSVAALTDQLDRPYEVAAAAALDDPAAQKVMLGSQVSGANAVIVLMPDGTGWLTQHTLQPLSSDRTYQLWAIVDGKIISAGVLGPDPGVISFHIDRAGFEGFAITEEVVGGVESSQNEAVVAWLAA